MNQQRRPNTVGARRPSGGCSRLPNADAVAAVVSRTDTVDAAAEALSEAGWSAAVSGNRIKVNHSVFFANHSVIARIAADAAGCRNWVVYGIGDMPRVRIVVSHDQAEER